MGHIEFLTKYKKISKCTLGIRGDPIAKQVSTAVAIEYAKYVITVVASHYACTPGNVQQRTSSFAKKLKTVLIPLSRTP